MAYKAGDVILIPFPYRDRLAESTRPAVVVSGDAYNQQGDLVIAAITSHTPRFATARVGRKPLSGVPPNDCTVI